MIIFFPSDILVAFGEQEWSMAEASRYNPDPMASSDEPIRD